MYGDVRDAERKGIQRHVSAKTEGEDEMELARPWYACPTARALPPVGKSGVVAVETVTSPLAERESVKGFYS